MRLTVLGKSPSWQDAGGACSGYLVEDNGTRVLLDCGNGVFAKLRERIDYVDVDAVVISHLHADHFLDLVPYSYALTYAPRQQPVPVHAWPGTDNPARPVLHAPAGRARHLPPRGRRLGQRGPDRERVRPRGVRPRRGARHRPDPDRLPGGAPLHRDVRDELHVDHRRRPADLRRGLPPDRGPREVREGSERGAPRGHAAASRARRRCAGTSPRRRRASTLAPPARARLVLVHISDELDPEWAREQAAEKFDGPVEVAAEGAVYEV